MVASRADGMYLRANHSNAEVLEVAEIMPHR